MASTLAPNPETLIKMRMKKETGRCEGQKPYGAREGERGVILQMKALQLAGRSLTAIATVLNNAVNQALNRAGGEPAILNGIKLQYEDLWLEHLNADVRCD
jgi:hypothetical protein